MPRWFPLALFSFLGLVPLVVAGILVWRAHTFEARSLATRGTVTSTTDDWINGERRYRATIEWTDRDHHSHTYDAFSENGGTYQKGQTLELRYDPSDPSDVRYAGGSSIAPWILALVGIAFLSISGQQLLKMRRS